MKTRNRIQILIIVFLLITNITTIITIAFHHSQHKKHFEQMNMRRPPLDATGKHFEKMLIHELNFNKEQANNFIEIRKSFLNNAKEIHDSMIIYRKIIDFELKKETSDSTKLLESAQKIGTFHTDLKLLTFQYIIDTKKLCTSEQQDKMFEIFDQMYHKRKFQCNENRERKEEN